MADGAAHVRSRNSRLDAFPPEGIGGDAIPTGYLLHWGHTVQNGAPIIDDSELTSFFFNPPSCEPKELEHFSVDGDQVAFLMVVPNTEAERTYAIEYGSAALGKLMEDSKFNFIIDDSANCSY